MQGFIQELCNVFIIFFRVNTYKHASDGGKTSYVSVLFYDIYVIMQFNLQGNGMETSLLFPK